MSKVAWEGPQEGCGVAVSLTRCVFTLNLILVALNVALHLSVPCWGCGGVGDGRSLRYPSPVALLKYPSQVVFR